MCSQPAVVQCVLCRLDPALAFSDTPAPDDHHQPLFTAYKLTEKKKTTNTKTVLLSFGKAVTRVCVFHATLQT